MVGFQAIDGNFPVMLVFTYLVNHLDQNGIKVVNFNCVSVGHVAPRSAASAATAQGTALL